MGGCGWAEDDLPDRVGVEKVNAAVVPDWQLLTTSNITFYFVHPKNISRFGLHSNVRGMSTASVPHPEVLGHLQPRGLTHLLQHVHVPTTSYTRLVASVTSVGLLTLDVEGREPGLLRDVIAECRRRQLCPEQIFFESKYIIANRANVLRGLGKAGYTCTAAGPYDTRCYSDKIQDVRQHDDATSGG